MIVKYDLLTILRNTYGNTRQLGTLGWQVHHLTRWCDLWGGGAHLQGTHFFMDSAKEAGIINFWIQVWIQVVTSASLNVWSCCFKLGLWGTGRYICIVTMHCNYNLGNVLSYYHIGNVPRKCLRDKIYARFSKVQQPRKLHITIHFILYHIAISLTFLSI